MRKYLARPELRQYKFRTMTLDNVVSFEELTSRITPMQRHIAVLRSDGYSDKESAAICGIRRQDVPVELENAKCRILNLHTDNTAMAA